MNKTVIFLESSTVLPPNPGELSSALFFVCLSIDVAYLRADLCFRRLGALVVTSSVSTLGRFPRTLQGFAYRLPYLDLARRSFYTKLSVLVLKASALKNIMSVYKTAGFVLMLVWISLMISSGVSGNIGRDFVVGFFSQHGGYTSKSNKLYVTSRNNALVRVEVPFLLLSQTYHVASDNMTTIELSGTVRMNAVTGKERKGIHVTSDHDIAVYGLSLESGSSDGFLGLPLNMTQTEYVVPSYTPSYYISLVGIVASEDNTVVVVTLRTSGTVTYKGIHYRNYETITENMDRLEIFQIACSADLTGTRVMSNKKVSVFSGNQCTNVKVSYCDHLVEQIPPVNQWGTHHVTSPTPMRTAGDIFRVLAAYTKTAISVGGNHTSLDQGDFAEYDIPSDDSREIECDKPCLVVKYNKGGSADFLGTDPFMTILPPVSKYTPAALVATPLLAGRGGRFTTLISIIMNTSDTSGLLVDNQLHGLTWEKIQGTEFSRTFMIANKTNYKISHQSEHARFLPLVSGHVTSESFGFPGSWSDDQNILGNCRPTLTFPDDVNQTCRDSIAVNITGFPSVQYSLCNTSVSFTYTDTFASNGRCPDSQQVIRRQFTGVDSFGRKYTHEQTITSFPTSAPEVTCSEDHMHVVIKLENYPYLDPNQMHLEDPSCTASEYNSTHILFRIRLNECGTVKSVNNGTLMFKNKVTGKVRSNDGSVITRWNRVEFIVSCSLQRNASLGGPSFKPQGVITVNEAGYGKQTFTMELYHSSQYQTVHENFPVDVALNERLYVQLEVTSNTYDLVLFTEKCTATPQPPTNIGHVLLEDGCVTDGTLQYNYQRSRRQRFSFQAFRFVDDYQTVYLQCDVLACHATSDDSRCTRGCLSQGRRKRREDSDSQEGYEKGSKSHAVTIGPIVKEDDKDNINKGTDDSQQSSIVPVVSGAVAGVLALAIICAAVLVALRMLRRKPAGPSQTANSIDNPGFDCKEMNTVA